MSNVHRARRTRPGNHRPAQTGADIDGRLNTLIDLQRVLRRPRHPRQVRDHQTRITTVLDPVNRVIQNRAITVRTLRIQLRRQNIYLHLVRCSPPANGGHLLIRTMKPVAFPSPHKGNTDIADERQRTRSHPQSLHYAPP